MAIFIDGISYRSNSRVSDQFNQAFEELSKKEKEYALAALEKAQSDILDQHKIKGHNANQVAHSQTYQGQKVTPQKKGIFSTTKTATIPYQTFGLITSGPKAIDKLSWIFFSLSKNICEKTFKVENAKNFSTLAEALNHLKGFEEQTDSLANHYVVTKASELEALHFSEFAKQNHCLLNTEGEYIDLKKPSSHNKIDGISIKDFNNTGKTPTGGDRKASEFIHYLVSRAIKKTTTGQDLKQFIENSSKLTQEFSQDCEAQAKRSEAIDILVRLSFDISYVADKKNMTDCVQTLYVEISHLQLILLRIQGLHEKMSDISTIEHQPDIEDAYEAYESETLFISSIIDKLYPGEENLFIQRELNALITNLDYQPHKIKAPLTILHDMLGDMANVYRKELEKSERQLEPLRKKVDDLREKRGRRRGGGTMIIM